MIISFEKERERQKEQDVSKLSWNCIIKNFNLYPTKFKIIRKNYTFEFSLVSRLSLDKLFWIWFVILAIIYINSVYLLSKYYNIYSILQKLTSTEKSTILH